MKRGRIIQWLLIFSFIVLVTQYLFIAYVPNIIFLIAKKCSAQPLNTVICAPKTDAKLRRVVLPNPDFIYDALFYDASNKDLLITGEFADSTQYCSLAFYGNNIQPYFVMNNQVGLKPKFKLRLSSVNRVRSDVITPTKQGAVLLRILVSDSTQMRNALALQRKLKVEQVEQNE